MCSTRASSTTHLAAGDADRGQVGGGHDPVGDDRVLGRVQLVDALDLDPRRARALDARPHRGEEGGEVADLGLAGRVLDDGRPLGEHRRHQDVVGRGVARELEHDAGRRSGPRRSGPLDVAVLGLEVGAHRGERRSGGSRSGGCRSRRRRASRPGPGRRGRAAGRGRRSRPASARRARRAPPAMSSAGAGESTTSSPCAGRSTLAPIAASTSAMMSTSAISGTFAQLVAALGEQARRHQLERRVLGPARPDRPMQRPVRPDDEALHRPPSMRLARLLRPGDQRVTYGVGSSGAQPLGSGP